MKGSRALAFMGVLLWFIFTMCSFLFDIPITIKEVGASVILILIAIYLEVSQKRKGEKE